jgi:hypothetical protein
MKTLNEKLTIEEAMELFKFKGPVNFPATSHNIKMMSLVVINQLKKLQTK